MPLYWGDQLAHKGVIVVTIAYRLGPLGFLSHPELTRESAQHSSGNYGLMDQIAALESTPDDGSSLRRRSEKRNHRRSANVQKRDIGQHPDGLAPGEGLVSARPSRKRQSGEPLQLAPKYLLANAEVDGEKYAVSLGASSLKELRRLPADRLTGNAGGIVHPVIEPYLLPVSPYEAFTSGRQNDVPLLLGSNADEARSLTDVSHVKAATFDGDIEHSFGQLPAPLIAAYPHATDEEARQARLDLERDLRFGWDMWAWARLQAGTENEGEVLLFFGSHGGDLFLGGEMSRLYRLTECGEKGSEKQWKSDRYAQRLCPIEMRRHPMSIVCLEDILELIVHFSPVAIPHKHLTASVIPLHKCDQTDFFRVADNTASTAMIGNGRIARGRLFCGHRAWILSCNLLHLQIRPRSRNLFDFRIGPLRRNRLKSRVGRGTGQRGRSRQVVARHHQVCVQVHTRHVEKLIHVNLCTRLALICV